MIEIYDAQPPESEDTWTKRRVIFLAISGFLSLILFFLVREVMLPFFLGSIIAYVLMPLVEWGELRLKLPRSLSILVVYVLVLGTIALSVTLMAPRIVDETVNFAREVPGMARNAARRHGPRIERWVNAYQTKATKETKAEKAPEAAFTVDPDGEGYSVQLGSGINLVEEEDGHWRLTPESERGVQEFQVARVVEEAVEGVVNYVQLNALQFVRLGQSILSGVSRGILLLFMTLMVAGYIMHTKESILSFFRSLPPKIHRPGFDFLLKRIDRGLSGVIRGQLLICLVNGVLSLIGFTIFGLKYGPVLALLAGVMSLIPIFGSILSTIPAVLIALTQDGWTAFQVLLWILGIHQVEANFLNPKIIGTAARLHPVLVVFSLLVGEHFYGLWGALFAVPVLSITQSVFNHFRFSLADAEVDSLRTPRKSEEPA